MSAYALDLAARWLGGSVVAASDESFGFKEQLLVEAPAAFTPGRYDHRGEIVDGWETRRRRPGQPGSDGEYDWVVVRLGAAGVVSELDVDTSFFNGNYPTHVRVEALAASGYPSAADLVAASAPWYEIAGWTALKGHCHNRVEVSDSRRFTHLRVGARPDGGIARLRVYGKAVPDPSLWSGVVELSGVENGGRLVWCSDDFYSSAERLLRPDRPTTMGEGWETARRRDTRHDTVIVALGSAGALSLVEVDTTHFKYNASAAFQLWGSSDAATSEPGAVSWRPLRARTELVPDQRHRFVLSGEQVSLVRFDAFPDGGVARLRVFGVPSEAARSAAEEQLATALPAQILRRS
jgi:allantoicase